MKLTSNFYKLVVLTFLLLILSADLIRKASWWYAVHEAQQTLAANPSFVEDLAFYGQQGKNWEQWARIAGPIEPVNDFINSLKSSIAWPILSYTSYGQAAEITSILFNRVVAIKKEIQGMASLSSAAIKAAAFLHDPTPISLQNLAQLYSEKVSNLEQIEVEIRWLGDTTNSLNLLVDNFHAALQYISAIPGISVMSSPAVSQLNQAFKGTKDLADAMSKHQLRMQRDLVTMNSLLGVTNTAKSIDNFFSPSFLRPFIAFVDRYPLIFLLFLSFLLIQEIRLLMRQQSLTLNQLVASVLQTKQRVI